MRKFVYPLVAVLCFYASSNCYAQSPEEMKSAKGQHKEFVSWYPKMDKEFNKALKEAKKAKRKADFDDLVYIEYKKELQNQYAKNVVPIINLQNRNPVVRGIGDKDLEKLRVDAESKYTKLFKLVREIETNLSKL